MRLAHIEARQRELGGSASSDAVPDEPAAGETLKPPPRVVVVESPRQPEPAWTSILTIVLVLSGVIAGALAALLTRDGSEGRAAR